MADQARTAMIQEAYSVVDPDTLAFVGAGIRTIQLLFGHKNLQNHDDLHPCH